MSTSSSGSLPSATSAACSTGSYRLADAVEPLADTGFDIISGRSGSGSLASIHHPHVARGFQVMGADELARLLLCDSGLRNLAFTFDEASS